MKHLEKSSKIGLVVGIAAIVLLVGLTFYYYGEWFALTNKSQMVDYAGLAWSWFLSDPAGALFGQTEGSAPYLKYFGLGLVWIWASFLIVRRFPKLEQFFWGNLAWCLLATFFVVMAWVYGAATQHFNWYACFSHVVNGQTYPCYPGEEGSMDKVTHFLSPAAIMAILLTINLQDSLGLHGRIGRGIELGIFLAFGLLLPIWWEYSEALAPTIYVSEYMNSVTDYLMGWLAAFFMAGWYNWCVPYSEA